MATNSKGGDGDKSANAIATSTPAVTSGLPSQADPTDATALTTLKPPAPYAEDVADDEAGGSKELVLQGGQSQERGHEDHVAAVAAAAAAAASVQDEEDARSLETQMRLAKGQRDAMNAVMQLAHAAANSGQHSMPAELQAQLAQQQKASGSNTAASNAGKRKRDEASTGDDAAAGSTSTALQASSGQTFQWSPEAQESFAKLFGNVSGNDIGKASDANAGNSQEQTGDTAMAEASGSKDAAKADEAAPTDTTGQDPDASTMTEGETTAELIARNGRALNPSKRAAQNRAAQRAFRMRREERVKDIEDKAKRTEEAERSAEHYKQRLDDALQTIETLRADNHSLRIAIEAVGLHAPTAAPAAATTRSSSPEHSEAAVAEPAAPSTSWATDAAPAEGAHSSNDKTVAASADSTEELGGLSAVAAAAAAAAAMGQATGDDAQSS